MNVSRPSPDPLTTSFYSAFLLPLKLTQSPVAISQMSMPTPAPSAVGGTPSTLLPEMISIQDLENGTLNIDALIEEIRILHQKIPALRFQMTNCLRTLANMDDSQGPSQAFQHIQREVVELKQMLETYSASYRRLMPVIRYAKLKSGLNPDDMTKVQRHEVKVLSSSDEITEVVGSPGSKPLGTKRYSTTKQVRPRAPSASKGKVTDSAGSASQPILL
ncbi:unnamed protein product [Kuraishia capsulata CBS 1993]|uniref:Uncharacterized protein n=1 Tax=Kuraishia capsulata CBS 1993 TaxID=1382522 RepID=W6MWT6_9ASCO|nr:uncharacterized protein KUCA_T00003819001 [Kuraishia capsulata CBS 1993]CDK27840.1 unnamed protein product [Kuraishia capsulata CBS 1993]